MVGGFLGGLGLEHSGQAIAGDLSGGEEGGGGGVRLRSWQTPADPHTQRKVRREKKEIC